MAANPNELALRYLLALSSDIQTAVLLDESGKLLASAPSPLAHPDPAAIGALLESTLALRSVGSSDLVELDVMLETAAVYVLISDGLALACTANRQSLPGIVFHEMRSVLDDVAGSDNRPLREAGA